jgi:protein CpxP
METLTKNRSLVTIIIFLLFTNIAMLVFFLLLDKAPQRNSRGREQNGMSTMLQKEVGFNNDQLDAYQSLRKGQLDTVHTLFDDVRKSKMDFYSLIYSNQVPDSTVIAGAEMIAEKQKVLDLYMFKHFKEVRNICAPDQLEKFDSAIKKIFIRMTGREGYPQKK